MWRRLRNFIIDPRKLAMDVAKFSACFCHPRYRPSSVSLVGNYDGRYFSVERTVFAYNWVTSQRYKASTLVLPFVKVTLTQSSSAPKNSSLLHWLVSLSYGLTESPWGMQRMKVWKSYGMICLRKMLILRISETQTLVVSLQIGFSGSPAASSYYCCCSWL